MKLFDEIPYIESQRLILRPLGSSDAAALCLIADDEEVYKYLPTFLYERKYADKSLVIDRYIKECFEPKESILLGVCLKSAPENVIGIAEIYNYEPQKEKASIGYRLKRDCWHQGIATEVAAILKNYLLTTDVRKITAHVMTENAASERVLEKNGFIAKWTSLSEDWGRPEPVIVDKYIYKKERSQ